VGVFDAGQSSRKRRPSESSFYFKDEQLKALQGRTNSLNEKNNALTRVIAMEEELGSSIMSGREKLQLFVPLTGSCQFVRTKVLEELGGWDENSLTEDVEISFTSS